MHVFPFFLDPLVQHLQLVHDGHLPGGLGHHDPDANSEEGLRQVLQRGGHGRHGERSGRRVRMETGWWCKVPREHFIVGLGN